ncbi:MAG: 50S ribosomal protein L25 [Deltaproteobacteria bacterium]|nr:50S ribosomal protein L25 [Deltaproteobacteria bacterium]
MGDVQFAVEGREATGKGANRRLRQRGLVPGVVYGGGRAATPIAFDVAKFERLLATSHSGHNTIIDLSGPAAVSGKTVIAKELQREAVRGRITHVDFYEVDLTTKIDVEIPIHLVGTPVGVVNGGVLDQQLRELEIMCLPNAIPDSIEVDVSALDLGSNLHVSDLVVPDGIDVMSEAELTVATVLIPRGLRDEATAAQEAAAGAPAAAPAKAEKSE